MLERLIFDYTHPDLNTPKKSAEFLTKKINTLLAQGKKVCITYSANNVQAEKIYQSYSMGRDIDGLITGSNQAEVFEELLKILHKDKINVWENFRVLPIATIMQGGTKKKVKIPHLIRDLTNIQGHLEAGWHVLVLTNPDSLKEKNQFKQTYQIGGGKADYFYDSEKAHVFFRSLKLSYGYFVEGVIETLFSAYGFFPIDKNIADALKVELHNIFLNNNHFLSSSNRSHTMYPRSTKKSTKEAKKLRDSVRDRSVSSQIESRKIQYNEYDPQPKKIQSLAELKEYIYEEFEEYIMQKTLWMNKARRKTNLDRYTIELQKIDEIYNIIFNRISGCGDIVIKKIIKDDYFISELCLFFGELTLEPERFKISFSYNKSALTHFVDQFVERSVSADLSSKSKSQDDDSISIKENKIINYKQKKGVLNSCLAFIEAFEDSLEDTNALFNYANTHQDKMLKKYIRDLLQNKPVNDVKCRRLYHFHYALRCNFYPALLGFFEKNPSEEDKVNLLFNLLLKVRKDLLKYRENTKHRPGFIKDYFEADSFKTIIRDLHLVFSDACSSHSHSRSLSTTSSDLNASSSDSLEISLDSEDEGYRSSSVRRLTSSSPSPRERELEERVAILESKMKLKEKEKELKKREKLLAEKERRFSAPTSSASSGVSAPTYTANSASLLHNFSIYTAPGSAEVPNISMAPDISARPVAPSTVNAPVFQGGPGSYPFSVFANPAVSSVPAPTAGHGQAVPFNAPFPQLPKQ